MSSRIYTEDVEIVKMFIDEWKKCFDVLEKDILKLEIHLDDNDLFDHIIRIVHSIKGGASFVGLSEMNWLAYEIEYILDLIKDRKLTVNTELIDSLLLIVDFFKAYTKRLHERLKEYDVTDSHVPLYFEFQNEQKEDQLFESIRAACETYEIDSKEEVNNQKNASEEDESLDILQSEEFKSGLAEGVKEQFLLENSEHIERIENDFLIRLDKNNHDRDAINEIFRAVHSIKGGTGIYLATLLPHSQVHAGLKKFLDVVHQFESLLALVRDKQCSFDKNLVDLSLIVVDYFKSFISAISSEDLNDLTDNGILDMILQQISHVQALAGSSGQSSAAMTRQEGGKAEDAKAQVSLTQSIRVNQEKLDKMMNTISELIIAKNSFMHISAKLNLEYDLPEMSKEVKQVGSYVNRISDELQNAIMSIRMVEVKTVFQKMPRVIRDIAQNTGKKMDLYMEGENTEIDKTIIEQISDPLVHLIRNSADHGIENTDERLAKGKPEIGKIVLRAYNKNKYVFIEIEDDGKGIDAEKIKRKAIDKGFLTENDAEKMTQSQLISLIFLPGFSMAKQITEVSGRGVGMDIVKSNITKINGIISIESEVDKGTKMTIRLPLSLAVSRGLIVEVSSETYIIPLEYIVETVKINRDNIHKFEDRYFTHLRGAAIGMEWLSKVFLTGERDPEKDELNAVILSTGAENFAIVVDKLRNEQEFVVKTLEGHLSSIPGISGSTLLGNGQVVLIVNPMDILQLIEK